MGRRRLRKRMIEERRELLFKLKTLAENGDWLRALRPWNGREMLRRGACPLFQRALGWPVDKRV